MKLIVAGPTGFVATEVIRQALADPVVSSVVALGRRPAAAPPGAGAAKLKSVVCDDFEHCPDHVRRELAGADACIWTIAITPSGVATMAWDDVCKICRDYAVAGIETISGLPCQDARGPLRFIYISGSNAERDAAKKPWILGDYCLMRGDVESRILAFAQRSAATVQAAVVKPGLINNPGKGTVAKTLRMVGCAVIGLPQIQVDEFAATLLQQAIHGIDKETLLNDDLVQLGREVLKAQK